jgi:hypothetical protein
MGIGEYQGLSEMIQKLKLTLRCNAGFSILGVALLLAGCASPDSIAPRAATISERLKSASEAATEIPSGTPEWGVACLSVASAREHPGHPAEMGTQVLMGHRVRLLKQARSWFYARTDDGYTSWVEAGTFARMTQGELEQWNSGPLVMVTAMEDTIHEAPELNSPAVSDVILANLLKGTATADGWLAVELPDGRHGYLRESSTQPYEDWKKTRRPTPENIEATARRFMGRPYLWGGNSPKGLDCSGLAQLCFYLNGIDLPRNSSQQAHCGAPVPLDEELTALKTGDLLFFGRPARGGQPERVVHVGIYLGAKLFIHSSERVQINSLDPAAANLDEHRIRTLLRARRILP